jgi:cytochrome o ubiquinol oxidase subunit 1
MLFAAIVHTFNYDRDFHIPADEVRAPRTARTRAWPRPEE